MKSDLIFANLLGMLLLASMATRLEAASSIKVIKNSSELQKTIESINENEIIYLDLTFNPSSVANNSECGRGQFGPLKYSRDFEFQIKPDTDNNHLLITVIPGAKTRFPYNAVSCPYNSIKPTEPLIRFRGYYIALHYTIPTANLIEFRPVTPPKQQTRQTK